MRKLVLLVLLGACGDDSVKRLPDGPTVAIDSPPLVIDAALQPVTLTITSSAATPVMGIKVYFQNADSSVVASIETDASGVASAIMEPGGFVTAVNPFLRTMTFGGGVNETLRTFAGVKPGDQLKLRDAQALAPINVTVQIPEELGADFYNLYSSCNQYGPMYIAGNTGSGALPSTAVTLYGCNGTADVMVTAHFQTVPAPTRALYQAAVPIADGQTVTLTATYADLAATTFDYTNVPAQFNSVALEYELATTRGRLGFDGYNSTTAANSMATTTISVPVTNALGIQRINPDDDDWVNGDHYMLAWGPSAATNTVDLAGLLHHYMTVPTFDVATATVGWTATATGVAPDFALASLYMDRNIFNPDAGVTTFQFWTWDLAAPYGTTSVKFPTLPGDAATYNPTGTDYVSVSEVITAKVPGGWDALRANILTLDDPSGLVAGPTGQIVYELAGYEGKGVTGAPRKPHPVFRPRIRSRH